MENICSLSSLPLMSQGVIESVECSDSLKNRMYDMGILKDTVIMPLYKSPFGDPTAYLIKNAVIALREGDCDNIFVTPIK